MVKSIFLVLVIMFNASCTSVKTKYLGNCKLKVPLDSNFFTKKYRQKYNVKLPSNTETSSIYIEVYNIGFEGKIFSHTSSYKELYKFYHNGCVNVFLMEKITQKINEISLNPSLNGYRGVTYKKDNKQVISLAEQINDSGTFGIRDYEMQIKGDTLFISSKFRTNTVVLVKTKLSEKNLTYRADW